jgi:hypothetical protein
VPTARVQVATAVGGLLDSLHARRGAECARVHFENMGRFLSRLARHAKPALRLFACELAGVLLFRQPAAAAAAAAADPTSAADVTGGNASMAAAADRDASCALELKPEGLRMRLLRTLFKRCSDKLPSVRAKALASIATAFQHEPTALQVMLGLGAAAWSATSDPSANVSALTANQSGLNTSLLNGSLNHSARRESMASVNFSAQGGTPGVSMLAEDGDDLVGDSDGVWEIVRRRSEDPKSFVRKSACQVLEARLHVALHSPAPSMPPIDARDAAALLKRCQDASVLVRKQALDAVTALVSQATPNPPTP